MLYINKIIYMKMKNRKTSHSAESQPSQAFSSPKIHK